MILVTGGAGFIGSFFIQSLNQRGRDDIIIVDHLGHGQKWKNLINLSWADFLHKDDFFTWLKEEKNAKKISFVFHMGACTSTTEKDVDYLFSNNVSFSQNIFSFCTEKNIPCVYASSAATYGGGDLGYDDDPKTLSDLRPLNPYGLSKKVFDSWVMKQKNTPPFWIGLKFFNVYGPHEDHKGSMKSLVAQSVPQILQSGTLKLFKSYMDNIADGEQKRDFIYVKDIADLMLFFLDSFENREIVSDSGIYNVGTGHARSFNELAEVIFLSLNKPINIQWIDMPESIRFQYQYFTQANMERIKKKVKYYNSFTSIEEGVSDYIKKYLLKETEYVDSSKFS